MSSQLLEILNGVKTMSIVGMCKTRENHHAQLDAAP